MPFRHAPRLALLAASAFVMLAAQAAAQGPYGPGWSDYPPGYEPGYGPPPGYDAMPYGPAGYGPPAYAQRPYAASPYAQAPYAQGPYAQGGYAPRDYNPGSYADNGYPQGPYAADPYAAQRRAWRRRQAQERAQAQAQAQAEQNDQYAQGPSAPPPAPVMAAPPVAAAAPAPPPVVAPPAFAALPADAPPPPPPVAAAAAAPPPSSPTPVAALALAPAPEAPKSVALAHKVVESASAYLAYMRKASQISPAFADGAAVAKEVRIGAGYEPKQFEEGAIAYAAIVALQDPAFVNGVRQAYAGEPGRGRQIAAQLMANPASAITFAGGERAAARASAALRRQGDALLVVGTRVKQSAYDVQHSAWSKGDVAEPEVRLAKVKALSTERLAPGREETDKLLRLVLAEQDEPGAFESVSPVVSRGLALAALAVMGQAGDDNAEALKPILAEEKGGECLHMAKLNLFQCLAVAGPHYEDVFCLGQHALMDTAQCVISASGLSHPTTMIASAAVAPTAAPVTPAPQEYWVAAGGGALTAARR